MKLGTAILAMVCAATWAVADRLEDTLYIPLDHPAIRYTAQPANDPVARQEKRLDSGTAKLEFAANAGGYLPSLLKLLGVNVDSQVLVFSKTSIQTTHISPRTPRAIYFNDDVTVGYVQNGDVLEITGLDPTQGVFMYSLDNVRSSQPQFGHRQDCLRCHQGPVTLGVPGLLISSVHPNTGERSGHGGAYMTDHRTKFEERWGGWYVTGTHGRQTHLGNNIGLTDSLQPGPPVKEGTQNLSRLDQFFDTSKYLAPTSDLVALMTLEHQTRMTNLMTRIGWDARIAQQEKKTDDASQKQLQSEIDEMVTYILFADEAPLGEPVAGVSTFAKTFPQRGPRDRQGRSLRDFDLQKRLFRYPLSYMIYSAAFDGLPDTVRQRVYQRLYDILSGKDQSPSFARLQAADRRAVLEIVRETKQNLPAYWRE